MPTTFSVSAPSSTRSPIPFDSLLLTATSSAAFGARPSEMVGMPGPFEGAPKTLTFLGTPPSRIVVPENTSGAALVTPSRCATSAATVSGNGDAPRYGPAAPDGMIHASTFVALTVSAAS